MLAPDVPDVLTSAVDDTPLARAADADALAALRDRLRAARLRVLVVGEAKRGKSTLVNALLGRPVLPTGITPLTAVAATVEHGTDEGLDVAFADGHTARFPLAALEDLGTERANAASRRGIAAITVRLDAPLLARGVEIVDTPGTGSVYARVRGLSMTTFVVLNKADHADPADLAEALEFTVRTVSEPAGPRLRVYPVSARAALTPADPGFAVFAADFAAYLGASSVTDLRRSAAAQLRRVAAGLIDEAALARRAAEMDGAAGDVAEAESARMLADLNAAAAQETGRLAAGLHAAIADVLDGELARARAAETARRKLHAIVARLDDGPR